jgi:hypothetical protein
MFKVDAFCHVISIRMLNNQFIPLFYHEMRKLLFIFLIVPLSLFSTEKIRHRSPWKLGGTVMLNFSQFSQKYWTAGGENSNSVIGNVSVFGNYDKRNIRWENSLDLGFGLQKLSSEDVGKSNDRFELNSKLGIKKTKSVYYTALLNFRTQFAPGYTDYNINLDSYIRNTNSSFMSPAYLTLAAGIEYKPKKFFSLVLSPLAEKTTIVVDEDISKGFNEGVFGLDKGEVFRTEIGLFQRMQFSADVMENVNLNTRLDLFLNYLDNPENIDVNWDLLVNLKVNDFLSANLNASLVYDDHARTASYKNVGTQVVYYQRGPRIQIKEMLGVGLCLRF